MTTVVVSAEAEKDLQEARNWLEANASLETALHLGTEFIAITDRMAAFPKAYPVYTNSVRRAHLDRFRYSLYYDYDSEEDIAAVLAMIHESRHPRVAADRLKNQP